MKSSIRQKLDLLVDRLDEIDRMLSSPDAASDMAQFTRLSRERAEVEPVAIQFNAFRQAEKDIAEAEAMLADPDMREFAEEEMAVAKARLPELEIELQKLLLPKDPNDERNVLLEIRAGTGGDESALFAGDLFRMYSRYAERQRWQVEVISASESELGGYREIICRLAGAGAYSRLKFESGGHRVQRVPVTSQPVQRREIRGRDKGLSRGEGNVAGRRGRGVRDRADVGAPPRTGPTGSASWCRWRRWASPKWSPPRAC